MFGGSVSSSFLALAELPASEAENAAKMVEGLPALHFSFSAGLLSLSLLILVSILFEKLGVKLGIPGSIFLFFAGLFSHVCGFSFESFPLEELHVVALCILLYLFLYSSNKKYNNCTVHS